MSTEKSHNVIIILERIKKAYKLKNDTALAEFLGVAQNTIATWKKRGRANLDLIISKCDDLSLDWLIRGRGPMRPGISIEFEREELSDEQKNIKHGFEAYTVQLINHIEHLPWNRATKLKVIDSLIKIVESDLENTRSEMPDSDARSSQNKD